MTTDEPNAIDPLADLIADELRALLREAAPYLRQLASNCEGCQGYGAKVLDDDREEPCEHCQPIWDLVKQIEPRRAPPPPVPVTTSIGDFDDDLPF